jgi:isoleucyl-tRNA synthetase
MSGKGKYKDTLNLPTTAFPMRGGLAKREPEFLATWESTDLYRQILAARAGAPHYILHDGPPYSNGHIHYGHVLNKILKDVVVKYKAMAGFYSPYVPGWDCHGLPIELAVDRELGDRKAAMSQVEIRQACREHALEYVDIQRREFKRLGIFGDWDEPYLTLEPTYEAAIVRALAAFARGGFLYRGKKPVYWCPSCATALAEAEIEYRDHRSPSIYVRFPLEEPVAGEPASLIIWTTTPWTLPANLAVVAHPEFDYVLVPSPGGDERWLVVRELAESTLRAAGVPASDIDPAQWVPLDRATLASLEGAGYRHPFLERRGDKDFRLWFADYVTKEQGTGLVHTAPGHGADDFKTGQTRGLETYAPIDERGRFTDEVPEWSGLGTFEANPKIVERLHDDGTLINRPGASLDHSYPHCWRCKGPVLFRATDQWFISIDHAALRERALAEIDNTEWVPAWGRNRIHGMIEKRPDWVLSRQRLWGVPIPAFYCEGCDAACADAEVMEHVATIFATEGSDAWYLREVADLLPPGYRCSSCGGAELRREQAIVDVWFESGTSWLAVAARSDDFADIDLYLEGSDQHRGWFHSSLLVGIGVSGTAPYKTVITHGFVLDERGHPYSKSEIEAARKRGEKIRYIAPEEIIDKYGAELLRLWVASIEFRNDMTYSEEVLRGLTDWYRKLRNTFRFMLGNLSDYDPDTTSLDDALLTDLDRYALAVLGDLVSRVREAYDRFELHTVHRSLVDYVSTDLSSFYLDVLKDRLYSDRADAPRRRAAQAVLHTVVATLAKLAAPILCFTAEDVWQHLGKKTGAAPSVHLTELPLGKRLASSDRLATEIATLLRYRELALAALEPFRAEKHRSEDAEVVIRPAAGDREVLERRLAELPDLLIVSSVVIDENAAGDPEVEIRQAPGDRCQRCWRYYRSMAASNPELCERCAEAVIAATAAADVGAS